MATANPYKITCERLLFCEGEEDKRFLQRLIEVYGCPRFQIFSVGGNDQFAPELIAVDATDTRRFRHGFVKSVVVIADNDDNPRSLFDRVCAQISRAMGPEFAPENPQEKTTTNPVFSVFMMPSTGVQGCLETLLLPAARMAERNAKDIDDFLCTIKGDRWQQHGRYDKAWLRTSLAVRAKDPFVPLGRVFSEAENRHLIDISDRSFHPLRDFLKTF